MVSSTGDDDPRFSIAKCQAVYAKMLPSIKRHARIAFRFLNPEEKQEARSERTRQRKTQDGVCRLGFDHLGRTADRRQVAKS